MEFDIVKAQDLQVLATLIKEYMKKGWQLHGEVVEQQGNYAQGVVRYPSKQNKRALANKRSWVAWPQF